MSLDNLFIALVIGMVILIVMMLIRVYLGPSIFDRLNGLGIIGTDAILILVILGFISEREGMFVDIAISYAMLGFISLVVIARYIERKGGSDT